MNSNTVKIDELKQNNANPSPLTAIFSKISLLPVHMTKIIYSNGFKNASFPIWNVKNPWESCRKNNLCWHFWPRSVIFWLNFYFTAFKISQPGQYDHYGPHREIHFWHFSYVILCLSFSTYLWWLLIAEKWFFSKLTI